MQKQKGMSLVGFLIVLAMVIFFAYLGMRIGPIYLENFSVKNAMKGMAQEPGVARMSPYVIKDKFSNRLYINYSEGNVGPDNVRITRNNGVWLNVKYEVRKPIFGNLEVIASFDERVMLRN